MVLAILLALLNLVGAVSMQWSTIAWLGIVLYPATFVATWILYVFAYACHAKFEDDKLHPIPAWIARVVVYVIGVPMDVWMQLDSSIPFLDWPRELMLTSRLKRYQREVPNSWRGKTARWVCRHLLNPFDRDGHC